VSEKEGFVIPNYLIELLKSGADLSEMLQPRISIKPLTPKQKRAAWRRNKKWEIGRTIYRLANRFGYYADCECE